MKFYLKLKLELRLIKMRIRESDENRAKEDFYKKQTDGHKVLQRTLQKTKMRMQKGLFKCHGNKIFISLLLKTSIAEVSPW